MAEELVSKYGALVSITNRDGDTALEKCQKSLSARIHGTFLFFTFFSWDKLITNNALDTISLQ